MTGTSAGRRREPFRSAPTGRPGGEGAGIPLQRAVCILLAALFLAGAAGCGSVPRIIVLKDPLTAEEHLDLGLSYERRGELDQALREYERALRRDGRLVQARVNRGNVYVAKGDYEKARREYERALDLRPGDPEATNNLAWTALLSGKSLPDAGRRLEAVLSDPARRSPALLDTLGVLRMREGKKEAADEALAEAAAACLRSGCPDEVRREIEEHRAEWRQRFP